MWKLCLAVRSLVPFPSSLGVAPKKSFITVSKLCKASHETPKLCNVRLSACLLASPSCQSVPRVCLYFYCFHSLFPSIPRREKKSYITTSKLVDHRAKHWRPVFSVYLLSFSCLSLCFHSLSLYPLCSHALFSYSTSTETLKYCC